MHKTAANTVCRRTILTTAAACWLTVICDAPLSVVPCQRRDGSTFALRITGGGITDNVPRILPSGLAAEIHTGAWSMPEPMSWLSVRRCLAVTTMLGPFASSNRKRDLRAPIAAAPGFRNAHPLTEELP